MRKWLLILLASLLAVAYFYRYEKLGEEYVENAYYIVYTKDRWLNQAWAQIHFPADAVLEVAVSASTRFQTRDAIEREVKKDMTKAIQTTNATYWRGIGTGVWAGVLGMVVLGAAWYSRRK
ncbi:hypothetical protein [Brevibacillus dissolubilis]|uniref:hypothetical protein n=1 Tax=Brevibacillus dissolubilis TaxID=1844116 RepID=UPI001115ADFD|nr:hypothetical protein [Brevibacillus dissolubilis]